LGACRSTTSPPSASFGDPEPFVPLPDEGPESIGYFLAMFDRSLTQWSELVLSASNTREKNELLALELNMEERARKRRDELLATLETGIAQNRRIAAATLGFSRDPTVLGPLLAVLDEEGDPELAQKALLGVGVLALPETPIEGPRRLLLTAPEAWTRNNAAFALLALARAGARAEGLEEACRAGLADEEAGVRAQCASALGVMGAAGAVPNLRELLGDESNLAALGAAVALARIGRDIPEEKGAVARALVATLDSVPEERRLQILRALRWLSGTDLGENTRPWLEWAAKLP
jgi:HEAT repeat protein